MATKFRIQPGDLDPRHGSVNGYQNHRCRCPECTEAWRVHYYQWKHSDPERVKRHAELERIRRARKREAVQ